MIKKFCLFLFMVLFASSALADAGVNIFAYSRKVPETKIYDVYGKAFKLKDFAGDFLIVVFWSKTCIPCIRELDNLSRFAEKTKDDGIKLILVSSAKEWVTEDEQKNFLKRYGAENLEAYVDKGADLADSFGIFTSPHTVLVNEKSMEIGRIKGAVEWDDDEVIEEIYRIKASY